MSPRKRKILDEIERHRATIAGTGIGQRQWESLENLVAIARMASDLEDERDSLRLLKSQIASTPTAPPTTPTHAHTPSLARRIWRILAG